MISVFFNCSSPYVGYTLKKADYVRRMMLPCGPEEMTPIGYQVFNSSGSYMVLATFHGRKYFHSRQSQSEQYDEQGRRIYTNIAFVSDDSMDDTVIRAIALYVFFEEEAFYKEIANMITLLDDGFTVDFHALSEFIDRFRANYSLIATSQESRKFFCAIKEGNKEYAIDFIVRESTWNYFVKQVKNDFNNSVAHQFSYNEALALSQSGEFRFTSQPDVPDQTEEYIHEPEHVLPADTTQNCVTAPILQEDTNTSSNAEIPQQAKIEPCEESRDDVTQIMDLIAQKEISLINKLRAFRNKLASNFWLALAIGIIGTVIAVLIIRKLK